jgi:hypothetical protein
MSFTPCITILLNKQKYPVGGTFSGLQQYLSIGNSITNPQPSHFLLNHQGSPNQYNSNQPTKASLPSTEKIVKGEEEGSSCRTCLYTGVATCTGISLYFASLYSELPSDGPRAAVKEVVKQKRFLLGGSALWATAGVYRLYLG